MRQGANLFSSVFYTAGFAIRLCKLHCWMTTQRCILHRQVAILLCILQDVWYTAESPFCSIRYTAVFFNALVVYHTPASHHYALYHTHWSRYLYYGVSFTDEPNFCQIYQWIFITIQNCPCVPLMGPGGAFWWILTTLKNLVSLSLF